MSAKCEELVAVLVVIWPAGPCALPAAVFEWIVQKGEFSVSKASLLTASHKVAESDWRPGKHSTHRYPTWWFFCWRWQRWRIRWR